MALLRTMHAAVFRDPGLIEVRSDVAIPQPGADEVLVRVKTCGICGSDMHLYRTNAHRGPGLLRVTDEGYEIPGHEYSGVIERVGARVTGWQAGDRVVGVTGGGAFAEWVPVPVNPWQLVRIPEGVSYDEAATTEPLADALQMVRLAQVARGENVVVFGVGIIGLGVIQALRALDMPVGQILAIDVSAARLDMAIEVGASHAFNPRDADVIDLAGKACGLVPTVFPPMHPPDIAVVFDCAGYLKHMQGPPPLQTAFELLRPQGGRVICFGAYEGQVTLDLTYLIEKQIRVIGSMGYAPEELTQALELMASGKVDRRKLISSSFPLSQISEAFAMQGDGRAIKVLVTPRRDAEL
jgi:threonine dehydrogenase-like Zn-dependent dehydrogenase